ncbi:MAG: ybcJ [Bacteroidota bacterium]|nr:ybcJ [Bacteroidota bacterium]
MITFKIKDDIILLNQLLKVMGWCENGAQANAVIEEGKVKVNGNVELRKRNKLIRGSIVEFDGEKVELE